MSAADILKQSDQPPPVQPGGAGKILTEADQPFFQRLLRKLNPTVEDINAGLKANASEPGVSFSAIPSAIRNIFEGIPKAGSALWNWEREHVPGMKEHTSPALTNEQIEAPIGSGLNLFMSPETAKTYTQHQPQNRAEELAMGAIEFAPGLLGGEGPLAGRLLTRIAAPMTATEVGGQAAKRIDPALEAPVRFIAGLITGGRTTGPTRELADAATLLNTTRGGVKAIYDVLRESGMPDAEIRANLSRYGVDANLMDVNPGALQAGERVYAKSGEGRTVLHEELTARDERAMPRTEADLRANLGPSINEDVHVKALEDRLSQLGQQQRQTHASQVASGEPGIQSIIDDIDARLLDEKSPSVIAALEQTKRSLMVKKTQPNQPDQPEAASKPILGARQAIDEHLYDANGQVKAGIGRKEKQALLDIRAKINEVLDTANPTLRAKDVEIEQAFTTGREDVLNQNMGKAISPEEFNVRWAAMAPSERTQVLAGMTRTIDEAVGLKANERVALKKVITGEGKWNHRKIATIVGQDKADALLNTLERESAFENTSRRVMQNSKTAETQDLTEGHPVTETMKDITTKAAAGGALAGVTGAIGGAVVGGATRGLTQRAVGPSSPGCSLAIARPMSCAPSN
jgi:hypothetical protein